MPSKASSLAAQLAELGNAAPSLYDDDLDSDPEALDAVKPRSGVGKRKVDGEDQEEDADDHARSHARHNLIDVAPSKLRKQANFIESIDDNIMDKYRGVKATRKEMMGEDDESQEEEMSDEEEEEGDEYSSDDGEEMLESRTENEDEEDQDEEYDSDEEEMSEGSDAMTRQKATKKQLRFAEEEEEESDEEATLPKKTKGTKDAAAKAAQADVELLAELKQRSVEDAQRGRDARRQIDAWGKLLGCRIRSQKVVRSTGRISGQAMNMFLSQVDENEEDKEALDATLNSLNKISLCLFEAQQTLLSSFAATEESGSLHDALQKWQSDFEEQDFNRPLKRKLDDDDSLKRQRESLLDLHANIYGSMWKDILAKWSWRTSNPTAEDRRKAKSKFDSSGAIGGGNGLKAIEQSAEEQIRRGMTGEAFERLSKRTRVWRGTENESRIEISTQSDDDDEEETGKAKENRDVFDDSDFYAALLRELIDNKGGLSTTDAEGSSASAAWAQAAKKAAKKHRAVDRKASKGRRLRYDVHEKVQSFMPPIPRETWSEEQIERLMRQLRSIYAGKTTKAVTDDEEEEQAGQFGHDEEEENKQKTSDVALDGLRLFG